MSVNRRTKAARSVLHQLGMLNGARKQALRLFRDGVAVPDVAERLNITLARADEIFNEYQEEVERQQLLALLANDQTDAKQTGIQQ